MICPGTPRKQRLHIWKATSGQGSDPKHSDQPCNFFGTRTRPQERTASFQIAKQNAEVAQQSAPLRSRAKDGYLPERDLTKDRQNNQK